MAKTAYLMSLTKDLKLAVMDKPRQKLHIKLVNYSQVIILIL